MGFVYRKIIFGLNGIQYYSLSKKRGNNRGPMEIRTWQDGVRFFWEARWMFYDACGYFITNADILLRL